MRKFNEREQDIVRKLVDYYYINQSSDTISKFLSEKIIPDDVRIVIQPDGNYIIYSKDNKKKEDFCSVLEIFNLFRYLVDNNLLIILPVGFNSTLLIGEKQTPLSFKDANNLIEFENGDYIKLKDAIWYNQNNEIKFEPVWITEKQLELKDYINSFPFVSPDLYALVKNDFKTIEEKTLTATRIAAIITFLALLAAIILPFVTKTRLNEEQHKEYIQTMDNVKEEITFSTNQVINAIDSLSFDVKKDITRSTEEEKDNSHTKGSKNN